MSDVVNLQSGFSPTHDSPEVSVIMPAYNNAAYIQQALDSLKNQSFKNWECIVVEDGSSDSTGEIADKFAVEDSRFKVIHQKNGGVSRARNTGLQNAKGKYIAFVDSDDWVEPQYLEWMVGKIKSLDADVVQCGYKKEFVDMSIRKPLVNEEKILSLNEAMPLFLKSQMPTLLWSKIYKKEIISEDFPVDMTFEDTYTMPAWFKNAKKIVLTPKILYHYRIRRSSITRIGIADNHYDCIQASVRLGNLVYETVPDKLEASQLNTYIFKVSIAGAKTIARKEKDLNKRHQVIKKIGEDLNLRETPSIKDLGLKLSLRAYLLKNHPVFFSRLMRGVNKLDLHAKFKKNNCFQ